MSFNTEKFERAKFKDRTESVPVAEFSPDIAKFFDLKKGEKPAWTIRALTGEELAIANQAVSENKAIEAVIEAATSRMKKEKVEGIKELAGIATEKVPDDLVKRYSILEQGSVDPVCSHELAMKLAREFATVFNLLTNKIIILTGAGRLGE